MAYSLFGMVLSCLCKNCSTTHLQAYRRNSRGSRVYLQDVWTYEGVIWYIRVRLSESERLSEFVPILSLSPPPKHTVSSITLYMCEDVSDCVPYFLPFSRALAIAIIAHRQCFTSFIRVLARFFFFGLLFYDLFSASVSDQIRFM